MPVLVRHIPSIDNVAVPIVVRVDLAVLSVVILVDIPIFSHPTMWHLRQDLQTTCCNRRRANMVPLFDSGCPVKLKPSGALFRSAFDQAVVMRSIHLSLVVSHIRLDKYTS